MRVAIIGAGNMGGALARGLAQGTIIRREDICVSNPGEGKLKALREDFPEIRGRKDCFCIVRRGDLLDLSSYFTFT